MSRTDAHRPSWVWINDHPALVREEHNHAHGSCDLPTTPLAGPEDYGARPGRTCQVRLDWNVRLCSCALCSNRPARRRALRSRRTAERAYLRAALAVADPGWLERLEGDMTARR